VAIELAPSILSADFSRLGQHAESAIEGGGTVLHVDIMDGHFVPNITIGPPVVASLRKAVPDVPFDCHLMIENPDEFIPAFAEAGATWISVHQEACVHLDRTLHLIASHGCKPGVVINPATPVAMLDEVLDIVYHVLVMSVNPGFGGQKFIRNSLKKIEFLARIREKRGLSYRIEVDGGVDLTTVGDVVRARGGQCGVWSWRREAQCGGVASGGAINDVGASVRAGWKPFDTRGTGGTNSFRGQSPPLSWRCRSESSDDPQISPEIVSTLSIRRVDLQSTS
jgi:ribulose-phosphate 3-epimerase